MSIFERDFDHEIAQERQLARREAQARHTDDELLAAVAAARDEALAQGRAEGRAEAEAEARAAEDAARSAALERIAGRLGEIMAQEARHRAALEAQLLDYAATTAATVLPEIFEVHAHRRALAQIRRGLRLGLGAARLDIALPPGSQDLQREVEALIADRNLGARAHVTIDPELVPGDARVFWEGGNLDYSFAQICGAILSTLRASARPHPQAEDRT
ncbi:hypothetical protein [Limimaricola soesokkakensis]|uniref:hypothetical protein n=1 Tax=Limimaricola soesokkakensis TaxID=1343159 RepID=UPI00351850C4